MEACQYTFCDVYMQSGSKVGSVQCSFLARHVALPKIKSCRLSQNQVKVFTQLEVSHKARDYGCEVLQLPA